MEEEDEYGETWLPISEDLVKFIIGRGGRNIKHIIETTDTRIRKVDGHYDDNLAYFVIKGTSRKRYLAKQKIKQNVNSAKNKSIGRYLNWFPFVDGKEEDTYVLEECDFQDYESKLAVKSPIKDYNGRGNYGLLLQELAKVLQENENNNRENNVWCHYGKIYIKEQPQGSEYSMLELEKHILPKKLFAPDETKWRVQFFSGIPNTPHRLSLFYQWVYSSPIHESYRRCDITYLTPSCNEIRVKVFMTWDKDEGVYKNTSCHRDIHEIFNVILTSDTPPYFYICESTFRAALIDVFQPSSNTDFRFLVEANRRSFSPDEEIYQEAEVLFKYVKSNLKTTKEGEVILPKENCPEEFDKSYIRTAFRQTYQIVLSEEVSITARLSSEEDPNCVFPSNVQHGDLDIHLEIENCRTMTPEQILDKVPHLMNCARDLARILTSADENPGTVPPEILARGPQAQVVYNEALKKGKVKNRRVLLVLVGQARSGKTSLLRSLNGEEFNPHEDSTVGAKLQRSLSKAEEKAWEINQNDDNVLFNQVVSTGLAKTLSEKPKHEEVDVDYPADQKDGYEENEFENDNTAGIVGSVDHQSDDANAQTAPQSSDGYLQEDPEQVDEQTAETMKKHLPEAQEKIKMAAALPSEVINYTASLLEDSNEQNQMENSIFFDTMDFAGQPVYSVTHPVFLPPKAVYLLVHSLENPLHAQSIPIVRSHSVEREIVDENDTSTNLDHLKFWLSLIAANSTQEGCCPVFLVSTHADKVSETDSNDISRKILEIRKDKSFLPGKHLELGIYTVDNTVSGKASLQDPCISKLKEDLREKVKDLPQCKEDIPYRWLLFEKELNRLRKEGKKEISLMEVGKIAVKCGVDTSSNELQTLLNYLHDLKVIIHFPETMNTIVIDTQWLLDMFAKVITVQPIQFHKGYEDEWSRLEDEGIVDIQFLKHLWKDLLNNDTSIESLVAIMEKFSLVCKQRDGSLLVPAMLFNGNTAETWADIMNDDSLLPPLVIRFESSHLPFGLFPRLIIAVNKMCHTEWASSETPHLSRNFARFEIKIEDDELDVFFMSDTSTIAVALSVHQQNHHHHYSRLYQAISQFLRNTLNDMHQTFPWMKTLKFDFCIRCPICVCSRPCTQHKNVDCHRDSCVHLIPESELSKPRPRCAKNPTKLNNTIPDSTFSHWFPRQQYVQEGEADGATNIAKAANKPEDELSKDIVQMLENTFISCTDEQATEKVKELAVRLGLDKNSVADPPDDIRQKSRACHKHLVANGMHNCIEAMKNEFPCGMTGPRKPQCLVKNMDFEKKQLLSYALTVKEMEWKEFAKTHVGLHGEKVEFLDTREKNPVLEILNKYCGEWTLDQLYIALVESGLSADADEYL